MPKFALIDNEFSVFYSPALLNLASTQGTTSRIFLHNPIRTFETKPKVRAALFKQDDLLIESRFASLFIGSLVHQHILPLFDTLEPDHLTKNSIPAFIIS
jgi:hypothetical protein